MYQKSIKKHGNCPWKNAPNRNTGSQMLHFISMPRCVQLYLSVYTGIKEEPDLAIPTDDSQDEEPTKAKKRKWVTAVSAAVKLVVFSVCRVHFSWTLFKLCFYVVVVMFLPFSACFIFFPLSQEGGCKGSRYWQGGSDGGRTSSC